MKLAHPELRDRLAAEYVLGTMRGGARRRFAEMAAADTGLREHITRWENHLTPLAERLAPVNAPARVWRNIQARIAPNKAPQSATQAGWWTRAKVGFASFAAAIALTLVVLPYFRAAEEMPMLTAVLEEQGVARMVVEQPKAGMLMVNIVRPWKDATEHSMELWVIPADGAPRSLGLVNDQGSTMIRTAELDARLAGGAVLALSKEPRGGSPTGLPTGPVLCKGVIARNTDRARPQA